MDTQTLLEAAMLLSFGSAWPLATLKMLRSGKADGRGVGFTLAILGGYLAGASAKLVGLHAGQALPPVFWLYLANSLSVAAHLALQQRLGRRPLPSGAGARG